MDDCVFAVALNAEPIECARGRPRPSAGDTPSVSPNTYSSMSAMIKLGYTAQSSLRYT